MDRRSRHAKIRGALTERVERALDARVGSGKPCWGERGSQATERTGRLGRDRRIPLGRRAGPESDFRYSSPARAVNGDGSVFGVGLMIKTEGLKGAHR